MPDGRDLREVFPKGHMIKSPSGHHHFVVRRPRGWHVRGLPEDPDMLWISVCLECSEGDAGSFYLLPIHPLLTELEEGNPNVARH